MTPEQKIKHAIINDIAEYYLDDEAVTATLKTLILDVDNIDESYDIVCEEDLQWDILYGIREGQIETDIPSEISRHYESKSVAMQMTDGTWVGWTYWYGGGKYSEADEIDWMDKAYNLNCKEEEKVVVVRKFSKSEVSA